MAKTNNVICIAVPNKPAGLDSALQVIEENNISIEYMYSLNYIIKNQALMVLRLSSQNKDKQQIAKILEDNNIQIVTQQQINAL
jgi:hypothetical protein